MQDQKFNQYDFVDDIFHMVIALPWFLSSYKRITDNLQIRWRRWISGTPTTDCKIFAGSPQTKKYGVISSGSERLINVCRATNWRVGIICPTKGVACEPPQRVSTITSTLPIKRFFRSDNPPAAAARPGHVSAGRGCRQENSEHPETRLNRSPP